MIEKQSLQRCRCGPVDFEIGIVPRVGIRPNRGDKPRMWMCLVCGVKIHAADNRSGSVDDENFTMIAVVERKHTCERIDWMKFEKFDSYGLEPIEKLARCINRTVAVIDHADDYAFLSFGDQ